VKRPVVVVATRNRGKLREMRAFLDELGLEARGLDAFPEVPEVEEDGATFAANALKKARTVAAATGLPALADDSGLEVDALGGRPGVYSARFAGPGASDEANNAKLLAAMAGVPPGRRTARYRAVVALVVPPADGRPGWEETREATCEGEVLTAPRGTGGFGYDPLFYVPELGKTFAELTPEERQAVSHRFRALRALRPALERLLAPAAGDRDP